MIKIDNLTKYFGENKALDIKQLQIAEGSIVGLVGNNGAGKTTMLRLILDLCKANSGSVLSAGKDVSKFEEWKEYTGSFLDSGYLIEFLKPEEYFTLIGELNHISKEDLQVHLSKFDAFMNGEILGKKKLIKNYSAGNKQKIGIVAAMITNPKVLLLDEPFNFLDPSSQMEMLRLLRDLNNEFGTTMILSSHNIELVSEISSRIVLLEKGIVKKDISATAGEAIEELRTYFSIK
ncbi:MAG: ATP-binding cassette domain-containing protein [Paludibacteraceae bacterium]|nr:ATP-binding cassette domain-containing protein [Paludibacteraceae bacterium]